MLKTVIFDVDGTLVDSVDAHARSWVEAFARSDHHVDYAEMRRQIGKGGDQLLRAFLSEEEARSIGPQIERDRKEHFLREDLPYIKGFPGTRDLFQRILAEGKHIVLASSANGEEIDDYKRKAHIEDLVHDETSRDDAEKSKPHPDIFEAALAKLGAISPDEALVVGDSPWDAIAARRAGLRMIGLLCGGFPILELCDAGCVAIYRDPMDLLIQYDESLLAK